MKPQTRSAYFMYPYRGKNGDGSDVATIKDNVANAIALCNKIRVAIPQLHIYCPHEHEFMYNPWRAKMVTSEQIMSQCVSIALCCDIGIIAHNPSESEGMLQEIAAMNDMDKMMVFMHEESIGVPDSELSLVGKTQLQLAISEVDNNG